MEHIGTNLRAPLDFFLLAFEFRLLFTALLELYVVKSRFEDAERILSVILLAASLGILDGNSGRYVPHAHSGFDLIDVLSAVTSGTKSVPFEVRWINLYVNTVIYKRIDKDRAESGLTLSLCIKR